MEVDLVYPAMDEGLEVGGTGWTQPLGLLSIASWLRLYEPDITIRISDEDIGGIRSAEEYTGDVVGISVTICNYRRAAKIAESVKARGGKVIFGGPQATVFYENILRSNPSVDMVVRGDGEESLLRFLRGEDRDIIPNAAFLEEGHVRTGATRYMNLDSLPLPAYDLLELERYFRAFRARNRDGYERAVTYYTQKGCQWREKSGGCMFCGIPEQRHRAKSPQKVWEELSALKEQFGIDYVYEAGDDFAFDRKWLEELVETKPAQLRSLAFEISTRADRIDEETVKYLRKLGVVEVLIGMETGNHAQFRKLRKGYPWERNLKAADLLGREGMRVFPSLIIGVEGETYETLNDTISLANELKSGRYVERCLASIMTPIPGSAAYYEMLRVPELRDKYSGADVLSIRELQRDWLSHFTSITWESAMEAVRVVSCV